MTLRDERLRQALVGYVKRLATSRERSANAYPDDQRFTYTASILRKFAAYLEQLPADDPRWELLERAQEAAGATSGYLPTQATRTLLRRRGFSWSRVSVDPEVTFARLVECEHRGHLRPYNTDRQDAA